MGIWRLTTIGSLAKLSAVQLYLQAYFYEKLCDYFAWRPFIEQLSA